MKYRILWFGAFGGLALHLVGLGWDAYLHARDSTLAAREGVFTLSNPSHLLIIVGLGVTAGSLLGIGMTWLNDRQVGGAGRGAAVLRTVSLPVAGLAAAGAIWLATLAEENTSHSHGESSAVAHANAVPHVDAPLEAGEAALASDAADVHEHETKPRPATVASAEAMGEGNAHFHSQEVEASPDELLAAARFYEDVKANASQWEDVAAALDAGYVQITQDLPGIAAHFYHAGLNKDGVLMDPARPETLLYTKRLDGSWRLVGFMFSSETVTDEPPSFFGALDAWHRHENLCFTLAGVAVTKANECRGTFVPTTPWNLHVWTAEGASGVFAHDFEPISPGAFPGATRAAQQELLVRNR